MANEATHFDESDTALHPDRGTRSSSQFDEDPSDFKQFKFRVELRRSSNDTNDGFNKSGEFCVKTFVHDTFRNANPYLICGRHVDWEKFLEYIKKIFKIKDKKIIVQFGFVERSITGGPCSSIWVKGSIAFIEVSRLIGHLGRSQIAT